MNLGGPVWHASVARLHPLQITRNELRRMTRAVLRDVGDRRLGEWEEYTGRAFHLRRRLSPLEQNLVGPVVDIRRTDEARERAARLGPMIEYAPQQIIDEEIGS